MDQSMANELELLSKIEGIAENLKYESTKQAEDIKAQVVVRYKEMQNIQTQSNILEAALKENNDVRMKQFATLEQCN